LNGLAEDGTWFGNRHHGKMTDAEWEDAYRAAWHAFYTPEPMDIILRRPAANPKGQDGNDAFHDPVVLPHDPV
jgi:hypothetical protein